MGRTRNIRMTHRRLEAVSAAIQALYRPLPLDEFPRLVVRTLEEAVALDSASYNVFQADGTVRVGFRSTGAAPHARFLPAFQKHVPQHPLHGALLRGDLGAGKRISDVSPMARFWKTPLFNEYYRQVGVRHQIVGGFAHRGDVIGIAANRGGDDFPDEELLAANLLLSHLQQALLACEALHEASGAARGMTVAHEREGRGVVCFDFDERILLASPLAGELSWALFRCRPLEGAPLPGPLRDQVRAMRGHPGDGLPVPRRSRSFRDAGGIEVTLRLSLDPERGNHCLLFERERACRSPEQLRPLGLTKRETEVAHWILHGKTNWEIAVILHISPRTAEKHVENILGKLAVHNRAEFAARARQLCEIG